MSTLDTGQKAGLEQLVEGWAAAIRRKDVDAILEAYSPEIVSFDLGPPMEYRGLNAYRRPWEETFASFDGPVDYEVRDLTITAGETVAFSHSFNRMAGLMTDGQQMDIWVRWTACYARNDDRWLITHEQVSVPVNLETGQAELSLRPEADHGSIG